MRTWGGRFSEEPDALAAEFGWSIHVDRELALDDLAGSTAHVRGLGRAGLLTPGEVDELLRGLAVLEEDVRTGRMDWDPTLEDVHMNLEVALGRVVGGVAGKLHTGRSRNDQVATDLRLWLRRRIDELDGRLLDLERALVGLARREQDTVMPGHTHVQPAQPVLFAHHLLAHAPGMGHVLGHVRAAEQRQQQAGQGHELAPANLVCGAQASRRRPEKQRNDEFPAAKMGDAHCVSPMWACQDWMYCSTVPLPAGVL